MATNAILSEEEAMKQSSQRSAEPISEPMSARRWQAVVDHDSTLDGTFVFAVSSTGIFCRPSCPAKRPRRENVTFFEHTLEAEQAGYRACLRCRPKALDGDPQSAY
jgi:methylphosphotriester-DNA--protein-cysteine methyltransferase